jgi:hypothetical protein
MTQTNKPATIFWAIFALFVTTLVLHAVIFPLNGATVDDWSYYYLGHVGETTFYGSDRQFLMLYTNFLEWVIPGNSTSRTFIQPLFIAYNASLLFVLMRRFLSDKAMLPYLVAFFYIVYYPHNYDLARTLFSGGVYIWLHVLFLTSVVCFYESLFAHTNRRAVLLMLLAALCGFMSIRGFEGSIIMVLSTPLGLLFFPHQWHKRTFALTSIWLLLVGLALWRFLSYSLPTMSGYGAAYLPEQPITLSIVLERTPLFFRLAFPIERTFIPQSNYTVPALLAAVTALCAFWLFKRKSSWVTLHSWREFAAVLLVGLAGIYYIGAGAGAWVYTGFTEQFYVQRMFFFSQIGQALLLGSIAALMCYLLRRILAVSLTIPLTVTIGFFSFMGAHWYYDAQLYASRISAETRYFHESLEMFRDVTGLIPYVADDTIVILFCERNPEYGPLLWSPATVYAGGLLYDDMRVAHQEEVVFESDRVINYNRHRDNELVFSYDQIIGLECVENRWQIAPYLPESLGVDAADAALYQPYLRITGGLLPPERTRMLNWGTVRVQGYEP